jgi:hypothetical protein
MAPAAFPAQDACRPSAGTGTGDQGVRIAVGGDAQYLGSAGGDELPAGLRLRKTSGIMVWSTPSIRHTHLAGSTERFRQRGSSVAIPLSRCAQPKSPSRW